ncbi:unnamed protein product [Macrosiphum euphorbiae]|uniref:DUF4371 domain-containing protein n=1 Tax=Macrosiphum euphorbiae TaxID=13131 RepID=A0AAV0XV33_9HEMI|nr:unnamed protein product [Macrosiphum euphorbiae]
MCDEAWCYKEEQLSICVRYTVKLQAYERFLGFVNVSSGQDADHIVSSIISYFESNKVDLKTLSIIAQSYDGASVMSGCLGGVQAKIKQLYPCAIYTHCMAHRLNLVVVDMSIYVHFSRPSNNKKLCDIQMQLGLKKGTVLRICDTRWVCRYKNCQAMLLNFKSIIEFLTIEVDENNDKYAAQALGILTSIPKPEFLILITIIKTVLGIINVLSNKLQCKSATLGNSSNVVQSIITTFENMRSDREFTEIWQTITKLANENNVELSTACYKRKRKEPNALKEYVVTTTTGQECDDEQTDTSVKVFWRRTAYMAVIDTTLANLKYRFSYDSLKLANSIDSFCKMDYNNGLYFIEHYKVNLS